ncbi:MoaD/ThiS family protein [Maribacter algarum]|uniref:Molybdopterin synthase sulfur carrier subunit n=1 Tax=Maribacter algarum (ex Zhang et al. 2020) TaxID=2578118 RepID=A0A5S3PI12_9FLAO|nr:MoaD/ThiS family protein [Maribacter algarum]TMM53899.1 MoaD/ThiS family protein [Maribacter algarum]
MEVLLFGIAKDIVGESQLQFTESDKVPSSVSELKRMISETYPEFGKLTSLAVAVNSEYAEDNVPLDRNDEIAIIPPVSGG